MNKFIGIICAILFSLPALAQSDNDEEIMTLLGKGRYNGGYGALSVGYTEIDGKSAITMGAQGAWVIGHSLALGISGNSFVTETFSDNNARNINVAGGYGGLLIETIVLPKWPVHISIPVVMGAGGIAYTVQNNSSETSYENFVEDNDAFLFVEPGIELEFNMVRFMRIALKASYRLTTEVNMVNVSQEALTGLNVGIVFKFGAF